MPILYLHDVRAIIESIRKTPFVTVSFNKQPTVSCGDIITDNDGYDSGLWCVPRKTTTKPSAPHDSFANIVGLVISMVLSAWPGKSTWVAHR